MYPTNRKTTDEKKTEKKLPTLQYIRLNKLIRLVKFNWPFFMKKKSSLFSMTFFSATCMNMNTNTKTQTILHFACSITVNRFWYIAWNTTGRAVKYDLCWHFRTIRFVLKNENKHVEKAQSTCKRPYSPICIWTPENISLTHFSTCIFTILTFFVGLTCRIELALKKHIYIIHMYCGAMDRERQCWKMEKNTTL